jgi:protein-disulfide isomerase
MSSLGSAPLPPIGPDDHVLGPAGAPVAIVYADYECPHCAVLNGQLTARGEPWAFRHFPVRSTHPRAHAAACAAEAAALQGAFEAMHMSLFADQGRLEDPHLWARAERLGLDLERFDADRRSEPVLARVRRDFESGVRAGVVTTPTRFDLP